jgi:hypothetical protein
MELSRIRPVVEDDGPFWTLHVEVGRTAEDADRQLDARWTSIRHQLERGDLEPKVVEDIGERLHENTHAHGEARRTLVVSPRGVLFDEVQVGHSHRPETVDHGPLPDLSGWLAAADRDLPFVLAVVDREGAEVDTYRASSQPPTEHESLEGETYYITKVAEGDWAQKQFQQTAESTWHHNARLVADAVRSKVAAHRPRAVLVAGEVRARSEVAGLLAEHGAEGHRPEVVEVTSGGRAAGASEEALWTEVRQVLDRLRADADVEVTGRLEEARGRGEGAVHGVPEVADALSAARVDRLVLDPDAAAEHRVRPGDHPGLALPRSAAEAEELPADRTLVAAAALTGAELTLLPGEMSGGGGVAALLRWTQPTD